MNSEVMVLIPTKNKEITIEQFINWVYTGFKNSGYRERLFLPIFPRPAKLN